MIEKTKAQDQNFARLLESKDETIREQRDVIKTLKKELGFFERLFSKMRTGHPAPPNEIVDR